MLFKITCFYGHVYSKLQNQKHQHTLHDNFFLYTKYLVDSVFHSFNIMFIEKAKSAKIWTKTAIT